MTAVTLESLASKFNGAKIWEKGDIKRLYINAGYNTKKMTTKAYIYQDADGNFKISVYVECPNQNFTWIKGEQQRVISQIQQELDEILAEQKNEDVNINPDLHKL